MNGWQWMFQKRQVVAELLLVLSYSCWEKWGTLSTCVDVYILKIIMSFSIFYHIDFLIYVYKICSCRDKNLKSATETMQTLNNVLHIK